MPEEGLLDESVTDVGEDVAEPQVADNAEVKPEGSADTQPAQPAQAVSPASDDILEGDAPSEEEKAPAQRVAPEKYEAFKLADGTEIPEGEALGFAEAARELGLSQEEAQKLFPSVIDAAKAHFTKDLAGKKAQWAEDTRNDSELGGANFESNRGVASTAYKRFATPELRALFNTSGLSSHPEVVRLFYRLGKTMQQDTGVAGSAAPQTTRAPRYPKSNMVVD